ncbi:MAG: thioredoxin [Dehalococcoidia bacterium]|nr:thioredoxin [Dehalococcoidia bacterium]
MVFILFSENMKKNKPFIKIERKWSKRINLITAVLLFIAATLFYINSTKIPEGMFEDPKTGKPMLLGEVLIDELKQEPFSEWYNNEFDNYELDVELLGAISDPNQYNYELFLGTWCGDSRREVPRLEKIFIELGIDFNRIAIITVDRDKVSPENEQEGKDIRYVPTLIVKNNDVEIGRIVESPSSESATLESDLFEISLGIPPKPNYSLD